jgi:TPR repeat protein
MTIANRSWMLAAAMAAALGLTACGPETKLAPAEPVGTAPRPATTGARSVPPNIPAGEEAFRDGNYPKAFRLLSVLAFSGQPDAQLIIGLMNWEGLGTAKNTDAAMKLFQASAAQGNSRAMNVIGYSYDHGIGVETNLEEAVRWYRLAIEKGERRSLNNLGLLYAEGRGVPKDPAEAHRLWQLAIDQGHAPSMTNLAGAYADGNSVEKDMEKAMALWRQAAEKGDVTAMTSLSRHLLNGDGAQRNPADAYYWGLLAQRFVPLGEQADAVAKLVAQIQPELSPADKTSTEERAKLFKAAPASPS